MIDPRRTRTAEEADEHHFIRPGTDALLLFALVHVLFDEGLADPGERSRRSRDGLDEVARAGRAVHARGGRARRPGSRRRTSAASPASWPPRRRAAVYGRIGTCTQEFGTVASWLVDVLNLADRQPRPRGRRDVPAGRRRPRRTPPATPGRGRGVRFGRWHSRVRGLAEIFGELPVACLAEEIETPGRGPGPRADHDQRQPGAVDAQQRPARRGARPARLHGRLDVYVNETTRHADVILPAPSPLRRSHYDLALYQFAVRNVANYSPPVLPPEPELPDEWITLLRLAGIAAGLGPERRRGGARRAASPGRLIDRELGPPGRPSAAATPTSCWPRWSRASDPSGCST